MNMLFGFLTLSILGILILMLRLNKTADSKSDEKAVPHKLTTFEESKVVNPDLAVALVPVSSELQQEKRGGRIEPDASLPPDLDKIDSWPT